jgi:hypothetical protein
MSKQRYDPEQYEMLFVAGIHRQKSAEPYSKISSVMAWYKKREAELAMWARLRGQASFLSKLRSPPFTLEKTWRWAKARGAPHRGADGRFEKGHLRIGIYWGNSHTPSEIEAEFGKSFTRT